MTDLYLCIGGNPRVVKRTLDTVGCPPMKLLASYYIMKEHLPVVAHEGCVAWILDCGAFSARNAGTTIDLQAYIDFCLKLRELPKPPLEVYALDVIGDWRATEKNYEAMVLAGVDCIPTYHRGSPLEQLDHLASVAPKLALGGIAGWRGKARIEYVQQMLHRIWPKKVHGFGITAPSVLLGAPMHSADSTSWVVGPVQGNWAIYKSQINPLYRHGDLVPVVKHFQDLERKVKAKWSDVLGQL